MTVLAVATESNIESYLKESLPGARIIQYGHPMKALDNITEIKPDVVIWSMDDFPRHWKPFWASSKNYVQSGKLILISEQAIPDAEKKKAEALGIEDLYADGFFGNDLSKMLGKLKSLIPQTGATLNYVSLPEQRLLLNLNSGGVLVLQNCVLYPVHLTAELVPSFYSFKKTDEFARIRFDFEGTNYKLVVRTDWSKEHNSQVKLELVQASKDYNLLLEKLSKK